QPQLGHPFPNCCGYPLAETNPKTEEEGDVDDDGLRPRKRSAAFAVAVTSVASRGRRPQVLSPWRRRWQPEVLWTRNLGSSALVVLVPPLLSLRSTYMSHSPRQDEIESPFCARECGFAEKKLEATIPPFRGNRRVNSKATIMFSGFIDDEVHENIIWSEVPYLTDEQGDIYFEVNKEKEVLQSSVTDDKLVQDVMAILDEVYQLLLSDNISDWTNLETMQSCHPIYFAKKMEEVCSYL
ncbi:hypothetical protein BHE74_00051562, partial [Ensete ventricosum]